MHLNQPTGGLGKGKLAALGFVVPAGSGASFNGGIGPVNPALEGVPSIGFSKLGTELGVPNITTGQF